MTWELIDAKGIESYLAEKAEGNAQLLPLLKLALVKVIAKREENTAVLVTLPEDAPAWASDKFNSGVELRRFECTTSLDRQVDHIRDWISAAIANDAAWLKECDGLQPVRFKKLNTLEKLTAEADKDMRLANRALEAELKLVPPGDGEQVVKVMENGYRFVQLTTPAALDREGSAMGHCIGQGAYDGKLNEGTHQFFSLRDRNNEPHATLEVDTSKHAIIQCQGKANKRLVEKYLSQIDDFVQDRGWKLGTRASLCGLVQDATGKIYSIYNLPDGLEVKGALCLQGTPIAQLPDNLHVEGYLDLTNTQITHLPDGLKVRWGLILKNTPITDLKDNLQFGGYLDLSNTQITRIPKGLKLGGSLRLDDTQIAHLPDGIQFKHSISLRNTQITHLPDGLTVDGFLDVRGTKITKLPEGLKVERSLALSDTQMTHLPDGLKVRGDLLLDNTPITKLPDGLEVLGSLNLHKTLITCLPDDLRVRGDLDICGTAIRSIPAGVVRGKVLSDKGQLIKTVTHAAREAERRDASASSGLNR